MKLSTAKAGYAYHHQMIHLHQHNQQPEIKIGIKDSNQSHELKNINVTWKIKTVASKGLTFSYFFHGLWLAVTTTAN